MEGKTKNESVKLTTSGYRIYAPLLYALAKYVNYYDQKGK